MAFSLVSFVFASNTATIAVDGGGAARGGRAGGSRCDRAPPAGVAPTARRAADGHAGCAIIGAARAVREGLPAGWLVTVAAAAGGLPLVLTSLESFGIEVASRSLFILGGTGDGACRRLGGAGATFAWTSEQLREQLERVQELSARERERDSPRQRRAPNANANGPKPSDRPANSKRPACSSCRCCRRDCRSCVGWEAVASMQTASEVGGDYFDVRKMPGWRGHTGHRRCNRSWSAGRHTGRHHQGAVPGRRRPRRPRRRAQVMGAALRDLRLRGLFMALDHRPAASGRPRRSGDRRDAAGTAARRRRPGVVVGVPAPPLGAPIRFSVRDPHAARALRRPPRADDRRRARATGRARRAVRLANVPALAAKHRGRTVPSSSVPSKPTSTHSPAARRPTTRRCSSSPATSSDLRAPRRLTVMPVDLKVDGLRQYVAVGLCPTVDCRTKSGSYAR